VAGTTGKVGENQKKNLLKNQGRERVQRGEKKNKRGFRQAKSVCGLRKKPTKKKKSAKRSVRAKKTKEN